MQQGVSYEVIVVLKLRNGSGAKGFGLSVILFYNNFCFEVQVKNLCKAVRKMMKGMTKSLPISKRMVYNSYLNVISKDGAEGIDGETIEMFNANLKGNLYKLWNRMTSGSYFLPIHRDTNGAH